VAVIHDPEVSGFVAELGQSLVRGIEPQPFLYRFRVIVDSALNAFAVPGGYVYLHSATVLRAGSLDELAGVLGHEIAHVNAHHFARLQKQAQLPNLIAGIGAFAAAVATGEPGIAVLGQSANVALQLRFSRELEMEADQLGSVYMARAGYDPAAITRFFERILAERDRYPRDQLPPYLYTHPDVEARITSIQVAAQSLRPSASVDPRLREAFREAQARLGLLRESGRTTLPAHITVTDPGVGERAAAEAERLRSEGRPDEALALLTQAALREPEDPRLSFQIGELLYAEARYDGAVAAYRRTVALDPTRALVFHRLGMAHKARGDRVRAVYAFEQAERRARAGGNVAERARWEILQLDYGVVAESGFADGRTRGGAETPAGDSREAFATTDGRLAYWAKLTTPFVPHAGRFRARWRDPSGAVVQESRPQLAARTLVSIYEPQQPLAPGDWEVELVLEDDSIDRRRVPVQ
jgi:predicted Zn-dependent protease